MPNVIASFSEVERNRLLRRAQTDLFWLSTEILGSTLLTREFHKPMLDVWDERNRARAAGLYFKDEADFWARDYYKTTCMRARVIQAYLCDPQHTVTIWHAVEDMAQESAVAVGRQIQENKTLRRIAPPEMLPARMLKKFVTGGGFKLPTNRIGDAPSMRAWGTGSEATGGHSTIGVLDDAIGLNTILDSQMPTVRKWMGLTVGNVVRTEGGRKWAVGTRWAYDDIYSDWLASAAWDCRVRACYETNGVPDWNGQPVLYTRQQIEAKRSKMTDWEFAAQMMNDPVPSMELLWRPEFEVPCTKKEALEGRGVVFVFSDPAPALVGSLSGRDEKRRADGSKNPWATCCMRVRVNGQRREWVLLDGDYSKDWSVDEGFDRAFQMARKWGTGLVGYEATGQAINLYGSSARASARRCGVAWRPVELQATYQGKNAQFGALASIAARDCFRFCPETVPGRFWEEFQWQARRWMCLPSGGNGLKFDDCANVVSFCADPAVELFAPVEESGQDQDEEWEELQGRRRSRYCAV